MSDISVIFKAYDIRGKVGTELTPEIAFEIGRALAYWLPLKGVVAVGRDMRPDSAALSDGMINGLRRQGRDVWNIGEVTSDMVYFAVGHYDLSGGVMITASHNPGEYNGIKLCRDEARPIGEESGLFEIRDLVLKNKIKPSGKYGAVTQKNVSKEWIKHVLSFINPQKLQPLRIAVDAGNGMAGKIFPMLEPHLPFLVEEMYFELDGTFPNHIANPLEPKNLVDIQKRVKDFKCAAGVAFDGDGDRAVLVDEKGQALSGTVVTALLAKYFLAKNPGATVLYNAICGQAASEAIKDAGGKSVRTRVGHSFIKSDMRTYNAVFAGEHSGHYYFKNNYMADSGLIAATIVLYILSQSHKSLSQLVAPFRRAYVQIPETNFEVDNKNLVLKSLAAAFPDAKQDWLDGLTVKLNNVWFNARPSNTEPLLRLNAEASNETELNSIVKRVTRIIKSAK